MFSKKLTKKLLALGAAAMLALAAAGCGGSDKADAPKEAANGKLTIAINATFPPFESVKEGTHDYVGVDIDIARYIGQKLGKEVTFTDMKFASLVPTLQSGRADMIVSAISPTPLSARKAQATTALKNLKARKQALPWAPPMYRN